MKVLVTGASGNVGKYVIEELLSMNEKVVAAGTNEEKLKKMWGDKVDTLILDFMNPDTFEKALTGIDRVFLMRPPQLGKPEDLYPFIECMKDYNIKLVTFLSLMGVEKNPVPPHHKIEKFIENSGIPYSHIRPGFFMQNLSGIHGKEIKEKNEIFIPAGKSKVSFIDAADIGLAIAKVLHEPKKYKNTAHTLTGQESLDYYEIADILSRLTKQKITYTKPGFLAYRNHYINVRGLEKKYVNVTVALYFMTRMGTAKRVTNEFKQLTGKEPRTFEEFARCNMNYFVKGEMYEL
jgi:uncharacterized protein YbjT (DUF2867 family)